MIDSFRGKYKFLSNFYPCTVVYDGWVCGSTEHAYQLSKTINPIERQVIQQANTPGEAKALGGPDFCTLRPEFEEIRGLIMLNLQRQKYAPGTLLAKMLLATGDQELIEGNSWHDNKWGNCYCPKCTLIEGTNWLGIFLMKVRAELR
jgi:ribA/ribD-fused uncharacterized protein